MKVQSPAGNSFEKTAVRVSRVGIYANALLTVFKLLAGILAHSGAMISDAIHSASDVLSGIVVIIGIRISAKDSDAEHPYGHERYECVAAIVLAVVLCVTGLFIGRGAIVQLTSAAQEEIQKPGLLALIAAVVSIVCKEAMYWYTRSYARRLDSSALMAEAWHHRSDALSSVGALVGIWGARLGYPRLDAVASLVICALIVKAAYDIFIDAVDRMVDRSCSPELQGEIVACAESQQGVVRTGRLQTREFGNRIYVDLEVFADGDITLRQSSTISEQVHRAIETQFPKVKHITVRVVPEKDTSATDS